MRANEEFNQERFGWICSTMFGPMWMRMLGVKVGNNVWHAQTTVPFMLFFIMLQNGTLPGWVVCINTIFSTIGIAILTIILFIIIKWAFIGRYKVQHIVHESNLAYRYGFIVRLTQACLDSVLRLASGSIWLNWIWGLLGVKIGYKTLINNTVTYTEYDLLEIGDKCCIAEETVLQTHTYENWVNQTGKLLIGDKLSNVQLN